MMAWYRTLLALLLLPVAGGALADTMPPLRLPPGIDPSDTIAIMIAAAYRTGDDKTINAVVGVAKATFPDQVALIDRLAAGDAAELAQTRKEAQDRERARILQARFYEIWKGELEAGASRSTGTTDTFGVYSSAKLARDGINWRQKFSGRLDIQRTEGITTTERAIIAWQPNYKFDELLYSYGLVQYEHDRTLGYQNRVTLGGGLGYTALQTTRGKIDVEGGPALRWTDFTRSGSSTTIAGRASITAAFALSRTFSIRQDAAMYFEAKDTTLTSTSAIETTLIGALKGRLSYNIQFEQNTPDNTRSLDTITRATLVYQF
jgi:putative salt-induced outer membrane protein